ncbi:MAG: hypothetical protein P8172_14285, partial [Gammaproteobacteria bacterium]
MKRECFLALTTAVVLLSVSIGVPADPSDEQSRPVYGSKFMTESELTAFRERLQAAETEQERRRIRAEQQATVQQRARAMGVAVPDELNDDRPGNGRRAPRGEADGVDSDTARGDAGASRGADQYGTRTGPYG